MTTNGLYISGAAKMKAMSQSFDNMRMSHHHTRTLPGRSSRTNQGPNVSNNSSLIQHHNFGEFLFFLTTERSEVVPFLRGVRG